MIKKHSSRYDEIVPHILLVNMYIYTFLLDKNLAMCITYAKQHTTWALKMNLIVIDLPSLILTTHSQGREQKKPKNNFICRWGKWSSEVKELTQIHKAHKCQRSAWQAGLQGSWVHSFIPWMQSECVLFMDSLEGDVQTIFSWCKKSGSKFL